MIITTKTIYELYYAFYNKKLETLELEIKQAEREKEDILFLLEPYDSELCKLTNKSSFLSGNLSELMPYKIRTNREKYINVQIKLYYSAFKRSANKKAEVVRIKRIMIKYDVFLYIINNFNALLADEIADNRYKFTQSGFGSLEARLERKTYSRVVWDVSRINRQNLIDAGKIPYLKKEAEEAFKNGEEYKGEQWLTYRDETNLVYVYWNRHDIQAKRTNPNLKNYYFKVARGKEGLSNKVLSLRDKLTIEELNKYKSYDEFNK